MKNYLFDYEKFLKDVITRRNRYNVRNKTLAELCNVKVYNIEAFLKQIRNKNNADLNDDAIKEMKYMMPLMVWLGKTFEDYIIVTERKV